MIVETLKLIAEKGPLLCTAYALFAKTFKLSPISTSVQEMIDKANSKPTIRYMSEEETIKYIISTHER